MNDRWMKGGRVNQKRRTRNALLDAATDIIKNGGTPTISECAKKAYISLATAYRYFPSQTALLAEVPFYMRVPSSEEVFGSSASRPLAVEDRVELVASALHQICFEDERSARMYLRLSLERWLLAQESAEWSEKDNLTTRQARRLQLIEVALEPVENQLGVDKLDLLRSALAVVIGLESMIALTDVVGLNQDEAKKVTSWAARSLVRAALDTIENKEANQVQDPGPSHNDKKRPGRMA